MRVWLPGDSVCSLAPGLQSDRPRPMVCQLLSRASLALGIAIASARVRCAQPQGAGHQRSVEWHQHNVNALLYLLFALTFPFKAKNLLTEYGKIVHIVEVIIVM